MTTITTLYLHPHDYQTLIDTVRKDYPLSATAISSKMLSTLGFTVREQQIWNPKALNQWDEYVLSRWIDVIVLDFRETPQATMFRLRYSEHLNKAVNPPTVAFIS